jgi:geranylgeranyl diphosphate synthase type I
VISVFAKCVFAEEDKMLDILQDKKVDIERYLKALFRRKEAEFGRINNLGVDLCDRLYTFASGGKMIRGLFVSLGYALFRGDPAPERERNRVIQAGAAMELFQSALLVHDDIMDRDRKRRGMDTLFYQYSQMPALRKSADSYHLGEALGICAGDVSFFMAFEILSELDVRGDTYRKILSLTSREIEYVGIAQMQDVFNGAERDSVEDNEILKLYLYKTGRYTVSLPLMIGGLLAECPPGALESLEILGESLGIIFQLKDDELGIYGTRHEIGKSVGSDIREGKKTLYYSYLRKLASPEENRRLDSLFGNDGIGEKELRYIQGLAEKLGVREMVAAKVEKHVEKTRELIRRLPGTVDKYRDSLEEVVDWLTVRAY